MPAMLANIDNEELPVCRLCINVGQKELQHVLGVFPV